MQANSCRCRALSSLVAHQDFAEVDFEAELESEPVTSAKLRQAGCEGHLVHAECVFCMRSVLLYSFVVLVAFMASV